MSDHKTYPLLDHFAIGMAALCGIHCLMMPVLIAVLPIIATGFFAHKDFHLWMLLFVLPTTGLSIFMGCRKHKDKRTAILSLTGIGIMIAVTAFEYLSHASCTACGGCSRTAGAPIPPSAWINSIGGLFLATAHIRNFRLCRESRCCH